MASERFLEREESSFERDNFRAVVSVGEEVWRGDIEVLSVFPSTGFLTVMSMFNALFACVEMVCYGSAISKTIVDDDPVIIVGHPRTGTTHLHNLLTLDEDSFYTCRRLTSGFEFVSAVSKASEENVKNNHGRHETYG